MACLESNINTNFLTWNKVSGSLTLSELQSGGLPNLCDNISPVVPPEPSIPFPSGAVAYYKLDEASGAVIDSVAANNGTNVGATPNVAGKINTGYSFVANDYIDFGDLDIFSFNDGSSDLPFSISAWVKPVLGGVSIPVLTKYNQSFPTFNGEYSLFVLSDGKVLLQTLDGDSAVRCRTESIETLTNGVYSHIVATYDASAVNEGIKIYINGVAASLTYLGDDTSYVKMENTTSKLMIGVSLIDDASPRFADASMDEIGIFNKELSATEVSNLYNGGNGLPFST